MWSIWRDGIEHRLDAVPLHVVLQLEDRAGVPLSDLTPHRSGRQAAALCEALDVPADVPLAAIRPSRSTVPHMWSDGAPRGGRTLDAWIVKLVRHPYSFTPRQVREDFTLRDLELIVSADA